MRILYSHRIQSRDGMSVHVEELITAFMQAGHEVRVVGPRFYSQSAFGGESRTVALLRRFLPGMLSEIAELAYNLPAYLRLRRACREFHPDIIYERCNLYFLAGTALSRRTGIPLFLEVNSPLAEERARFGALRLRKIAEALEHFSWASATRVLAVTGVLRNMIAASGVPTNRVDVVPNGVVLSRFNNVRPPNDAEGVVLGFVGFVRIWHGLDAVIHAMAKQNEGPPVNLTVVGDGPVRAELEATANRLGLGARVLFTGVVTHEMVPGLVETFDVALQPKVTPYASPLKIFDYMAAGRAIVAPDQENIREILVHERTALLFDPDDPDAVWHAIMRLAQDPGLRAALGSAAKAELIARDFTWSGNARRIVEAARAELRARVDAPAV
jgi:glycosyltransferase involved in cell wall biosynthesis